MRVIAYFTAAVLGISSFTPAFAGEHMHMHVNHDHEHTRYQPPGASQSGADQNAPAHASQDNSQVQPASK